MNRTSIMKIMLGSSQGSSFRSSRPKVLIIIGAAVIVVLAAIAIFFFLQYQKVKSSPESQAKETTERVVLKVSKLYDVPSGESPTVALVQDQEKLKDQSFFEKVQNGDYLLIYNNAKLAMIYREKDNKLINVGPVSLDDAQATTNNKP